MDDGEIMSITNKQWTLASLGLAVLVAALFALGGRYRAVLVLFLPLGVWLGVRREPEEARIRPWIRVLGWLFVGFSVVVLIASIIAVVAGK